MNDFWIIDSGVTDHMTNQSSKRQNFEKSSTLSHVSVANGRGVPVLGKGKINILSKIIKFAALYVPSFTFKLMSVGRITNSLKCLVIFYPDKVIFHDLATKEQIGEGFYLNGLYYLSKDFRVPQVHLSLTQERHLWHQHLAHPSDHVLSSLFPNFCKESVQCKICHLSKSTRLPFSSSISRVNKPFELVHSDIWGPAPLDSFDGY